MLELGATGPRYDEWFMVPMRPLRGWKLSMNLHRTAARWAAGTWLVLTLPHSPAAGNGPSAGGLTRNDLRAKDPRYVRMVHGFNARLKDVAPLSMNPSALLRVHGGQCVRSADGASLSMNHWS